MLRKWISLVFVFCGFSTSIAATPSSPHISVTGTAVEKVVPDTINWTVTVSVFHKQLSQAKAKSDENVKIIFTSAEKLGINTIDIQTGYIDVRKEYVRDNYGNTRAFKGFNVTRSISVKQTDTSKFDDFLAAMLNNENIKVHYTLSSSKVFDVQFQTRLKSMQLAKQKAKRMAETLGASLGKVIQIEEVPTGEFHRPILNAQYTGQYDTITPTDGEIGTFAPGTIEVRISVGVIFELTHQEE